ncbi:hypothetical protein OHA84_38700 [Streptomyces sp. NBC_00513]|uniref:hypothetical protein n=1 Tax=unclassified Streptomyces TaxID=2593676 RepID=UPI0022595A27|nr:hypothetical protein [Streptomyces sp. NBC_00424]MCX5079379.1 hypothetical protein [Streptomyces sp. NBC_00424]MCX5079389.1 hypothetical protein [Streptomyces sp. NBC_00424]WUD46461.1 hypothetical protein OHA84_38750 [Streptomyces sp. NBC_00513]WUD46471.1 hypothetical protein OHA84_38700 [Streptomyces sp. NBC_00513]
MDLITFTHVVTRAGSAFGFFLLCVTAMSVFYSQGRKLKALKKRRIWLPWSGSFLTMVLASAVTAGLLGRISAGFTGTGNAMGRTVGDAAIGQAGAGAVPLSTGEVLTYSGSWIALILVVGLGLFVYFAKGWGERALALSGAVTGATWGITVAVGGWASMVLVPLVSWAGEVLIG